MAHYAVLRVAKLKTLGAVAALGQHNERLRETPNADPARAGHNERLAGSGNWVADVQARLNTVDGHIRSNAVLAIEHVMTASRDWFIHARPAQLQEWTERSMAWLRETYGQENVVAAVLHRDEITPHLQALVVPVDARGHLNARAFLGGTRHRLGALQTSYARAVEVLGLARGVQGSVAAHQTVRAFYARLEEPARTAGQVARELRVEAPARMTLHPVEWAEQQTAQVQARVVQAVSTMGAKTQDALFRAERAEGHVAVLTERLAEVERASAALRADYRVLADQTRQLDLGVVLRALGAAQSAPGAEQWRTSGGAVLTVRGQTWECGGAGRTGHGALALVMHTQGYTAGEAVGYLRETYGARVAQSALAQHTALERARSVEQAPLPPLRLPAPAEDRWSGVRAALTGEHGLPGKDIDALHAQGALYADAAGHGVFVHQGAQGEVTGATLHTLAPGAPWQGLAPGTRRSAGHFTLSYGQAGAREHCALVLVASPLEALSSRAVLARGPVQIVAAAEVAALPHQQIARTLAQGGAVLGAFPRDGRGERLWTEVVAEHVQREIAQGSAALRRVVPAREQDWVGELRAHQQDRRRSREQDRGR